jgi:hypothetical protein
MHEPQAEHERQHDPDADQNDGLLDQAQESGALARHPAANREDIQRSGHHRTSDEKERAGDVERQEPVVRAQRGERTLDAGWNLASGTSTS